MNKLDFLDLRSQYLELREGLDAAVRRVMDSGMYLLGPELESFEKEFKESLVGEGEGYAVGVNSGTDALVLSLLAEGIGTGDEVIAPAHTAIPTITAIRSTGATPVFCDVDPDTWVMDTRLLKSLIGPAVKAIIPVHLYGNAVDLTPVLALARARGLAVIEDVAQAYGTTYQGRQAGTWGDYGAFSFYPSKNLGAMGDGGAIFVRNPSRRDKLRQLRFYGQRDRYKADVEKGVNSRLDEIQAALLRVKLPKVEAWNAAKGRIAEFYRNFLAEHIPAWKVQSVTAECRPGLHLFVIRVPGRRDEIMSRMESLGIQCLVHYPVPVHRQGAFLQFARGPLPVVEALAQSILSLPLHPYLSPEHVERICAALREAQDA